MAELSGIESTPVTLTRLQEMIATLEREGRYFQPLSQKQDRVCAPCEGLKTPKDCYRFIKKNPSYLCFGCCFTAYPQIFRISNIDDL